LKLKDEIQAKKQTRVLADLSQQFYQSLSLRQYEKISNMKLLSKQQDVLQVFISYLIFTSYLKPNIYVK